MFHKKSRDELENTSEDYPSLCLKKKQLKNMSDNVCNNYTLPGAISHQNWYSHFESPNIV